MILPDVPENAQVRMRFLDLEHRNSRGLNRRIGVVLKHGDHLALISYDRGGFDHNFPMMPITPEMISMCGSEKFAAVIEMIRTL